MKDGKNIKKSKGSLYGKIMKLFINLSAVALTGIITFSYLKKNFIINLTPSINTGIYKIEEISEIKKGDIVTFNVDEDLYNFMLERGYIDKKIKGFIKKVAGMEGDEIEVGEHLIINKKIKKKLPKKDTLGRDLPLKEGKYILKKDEYFMLGDNARSFDSSYMGIIRKDQIKSKAELMIEF